ncbi:MAG: zinc/iron-chelating domain-containing protein [Desulfonatronovibrio sp. MSAO_Bac4]|nr:MAG: zinc/iron-chelating domain-containing protein [Desulfonatronovibrio sp. MSAO_Bac4]
MQCSKVNPTCCKLNPGTEKFCFPLSSGEIIKISEYLERNDFFTQEINDKEFIFRLTRLLPLPRKQVFQLFPLDRFHKRLKTDKGGRCILLRENGCMLPENIRPAYCRIYPFWFKDNRMTFIKDSQCLAQDNNQSVKELLKLFRTNYVDLQNHFDAMIERLTS